MPVRPISTDILITELADRIATIHLEGWLRVAVDGATPTRPEELADALVEPVKLRGRAVLRASATDFLRPASLRLEHGHTDPDARYAGWVDFGGLAREVLDPLGPGGTGRVLPSLWDPATDQATRADYLRLPPGGVLLMDGAMLLGRGLAWDFAVHLWLSPGALDRQIPDAERWTLPAYERYEREVGPAGRADVVVRVDHPARPAVLRD